MADPNSTITNVRMDGELLAQLSHQANLYGISRSELFRAVLAHYLSEPAAVRLAILASAPGAVRELVEKASGVLS
jgi:hypothetical protein